MSELLTQVPLETTRIGSRDLLVPPKHPAGLPVREQRDVLQLLDER